MLDFQRVLAMAIGLAAFFVRSLGAQTFYDTALRWQNTCDWGPYNQRPGLSQEQQHHMMMLGDSNGALLFADPLFGANAWEKYLYRPGQTAIPHDGSSWRVLHMAVPSWRSDDLLTGLNNCLNTTLTRRSAFLNTTPKRAWIQIGGNDILLFDKWVTIEYMPHLAHYEINRILNNVGKIVELLQANGRTVLLVSYFPLASSFVREGQAPLNPYTHLCGGSPRSEERQVLDPWHCDNEVAENLGKLKTWFEARLNLRLDDYLDMRFGMRDIDMRVGTALGLDTSLTGLFKNPAKVIQSKYDSIRGRRPAHSADPWQVWDWITHSPRGVVGWELAQAGDNRPLMNSIAVYRTGQRFAEIYNAQGTHIAGYRGTVSYLDIAPFFMNPFQAYGGRNELYYDEKHLNNDGFMIYGEKVAEFMSLAEYDIYFSDEDYVLAHQRPAVVYDTNPWDDDVALLMLCSFFGVCKI